MYKNLLESNNKKIKLQKQVGEDINREIMSEEMKINIFHQILIIKIFI